MSTEVEHTLGDINNSLENQEIYVNPLGSDDANGSFQNPVSSIHRAVEMAKNNSKIIFLGNIFSQNFIARFFIR